MAGAVLATTSPLATSGRYSAPVSGHSCQMGACLVGVGATGVEVDL